MRTIRRAIDLAAEFDAQPRWPSAPRSRRCTSRPTAPSRWSSGKRDRSSSWASPPFRRKLDQAARVVAELDKRGAKADAIMLDNDTRPDRVVVRMR